MVLWTYVQGSNGDTDIEIRGQSSGERERWEGGTNWESSTETYTLSSVKFDSQWELAGWCRELCDNLEGWDGVGRRFEKEGTYVYLWLIHADAWQNPTQQCKAIILQLNINFKIYVSFSWSTGVIGSCTWGWGGRKQGKKRCIFSSFGWCTPRG